MTWNEYIRSSSSWIYDFKTFWTGQKILRRLTLEQKWQTVCQNLTVFKWHGMSRLGHPHHKYMILRHFGLVNFFKKPGITTKIDWNPRELIWNQPDLTWNQPEFTWNQQELTEIHQNWSEIYQKWLGIKQNWNEIDQNWHEINQNCPKINQKLPKIN